MLVAGNAEIVNDRTIKNGLWQDEWEMYYEGGIDSPDYTIIRIRPVHAEHYHDLSKDTLELP
jgi:general stress protein 26